MIQNLAQFTDIKCGLIVGGLSVRVCIYLSLRMYLSVYTI
jgi:hypothetical protein